MTMNPSSNWIGKPFFVNHPPLDEMPPRHSSRKPEAEAEDNRNGWYLEKHGNLVWVAVHFINGAEASADGQPSTVQYRDKKLFYAQWSTEHYVWHRLDGPARVWIDKTTGLIHDLEYEIQDELVQEQQYWNHPLVVEYKLQNILNIQNHSELVL